VVALTDLAQSSIAGIGTTVCAAGDFTECGVFGGGNVGGIHTPIILPDGQESTLGAGGLLLFHPTTPVCLF